MISLHAFPDDLHGPASRLGRALGCSPFLIDVHRFACGETLPRVTGVSSDAVLYRSLHNPNAKLVDVLLSADALRRAGARRSILVAPYLPYLRQDAVFNAGEPLSRDVIVPLLAGAFDVIVTADPHLHRTLRLEDVCDRLAWRVVSGAAAMSECLQAEAPEIADVIVGPDCEAGQWVKIIADALHRPFWTFEKARGPDRRVALTPPPAAQVNGLRVLIADDLCTSGGSLCAAVEALAAMGAARIEAVVTHVMLDDRARRALHDAGLARLRSCDGCEHPTNAFPLAPTLAAALVKEIGR